MTSSNDLFSREDRFVLPTYRRLPVALVDGEGCVVRDEQGREFLDLLAGIAVTNLGHRHPALVAALKASADGLWHTSNLYFTEPQVALAEALCVAAGMERAFFCNSGAESIEAALKLARKHGSSRGGPSKVQIVAAEGSFHGRTYGAVSATGQAAYSAPFQPALPGIVHVPYGDADALATAIGPDTAALLLEPIQGEGGVRPAPAGYLAAARELCDAHGALLMLDEVQTGFGRTGTLFAFEATDETDGMRVVPDVLCVAKAIANGLPMGAMLTRGSAATALERGDHASTFGGGPLVASVARAVLHEVQQPALLGEVRRLGEVLRAGLAQVAERHADKVVEVRGRGLMWGIELREPVARSVIEAALQRGLLLGACGKHVLRLTPPLIIREDQLRTALATIAELIAEA